MGFNLQWTKQEDEFLIENYADKGRIFCSSLLNRTPGAITKRAKHFSLHSNRIKSLYSKENLEPIVKESKTYSELLQKLNLRAAGGNFDVIKKYIKKYELDVSHFNPMEKRIINLRRLGSVKVIPLAKILVENSNYCRGNLKQRLYKEGLKEKKCEKCGQDEMWHGQKMSLILDHKNGVWNDNRLENLQIVCPNCNATLETHCRGIKRKEKKIAKEKQYKPRLDKRKTVRPDYETLTSQIKKLGYSATGRLYGVSDNAIRLWIKNY